MEPFGLWITKYFLEDLKRIDKLIKELNGILSMKFMQKGSFWQGSIDFDNNKYFFQIQYTWVYPLYPPNLFCFADENYDKIWVHEKWKSHSYKDGHLCLFTKDSGESSWKNNYRLDKVIEKIHHFA